MIGPRPARYPHDASLSLSVASVSGPTSADACSPGTAKRAGDLRPSTRALRGTRSGPAASGEPGAPDPDRRYVLPRHDGAVGPRDARPHPPARDPYGATTVTSVAAPKLNPPAPGPGLAFGSRDTPGFAVWAPGVTLTSLPTATALAVAGVAAW